MDYTCKNIMITGVAGFIASNFLVYMINKYPNYNYIGIDKMSYCSSVKNFEEVIDKTNFKFIKADILDLNFIDYILKEYNIDTILHFAAYTHVDDSFGNSLEFTKNNVLGSHCLIETAKKNNIKRFIHVSTDEVYGSQTGESDEGSVLQSTNMYSGSKAGIEQIAKSYFHSFKFPVIITRGNNVYGPKQYPEKVIPKFTLRLLKDLKCNIHGSGQQLRSFLHVDDVVQAFDVVLHKGIIGEIYNIGCTDEHSVLSVSKDIVEILKPEEDFNDWISHGKDRDFNDQRYFISTKKLEALGWKQQIFFKEGLLKTIDWYKNNLNHWDDHDIDSVLNK
jgi:dTDP-glucose 4,6-dehydratase